MKKNLLLIFLSSTLLLACTAPKKTTPSNNKTVAQQVATGSDESALFWQQTSAEYAALCYQAYNAAKVELEEIFEKKEYIKQPVIIMDLDETVLDNSPYNAKLLLENKSYSEETWNGWVEMQQAEPVPGAVDFISFALEKDFQIIFVSNRSHEYLLPTMENVNSFGFDFNEKNFALKRTTSEKVNRRRKVGEDFDIVMLIGDNLADFNNKLDDRNLTVSKRKEIVDAEFENFGAKFIILPNVMYGNWQKALKLDDNKSIVDPKRSGQRRYLRSY